MDKWYIDFVERDEKIDKIVLSHIPITGVYLQRLQQNLIGQVSVEDLQLSIFRLLSRKEIRGRNLNKGLLLRKSY